MAQWAPYACPRYQYANKRCLRVGAAILIDQFYCPGSQRHPDGKAQVIVPGLPLVLSIELRQALVTYQDHHMFCCCCSLDAVPELQRGRRDLEHRLPRHLRLAHGRHGGAPRVRAEPAVHGHPAEERQAHADGSAAWQAPGRGPLGVQLRARLDGGLHARAVQQHERQPRGAHAAHAAAQFAVVTKRSVTQYCAALLFLSRFTLLLSSIISS